MKVDKTFIMGELHQMKSKSVNNGNKKQKKKSKNSRDNIHIFRRITRIIKKKDDRLAEIPEEVLIKSLRIIFYGVLAGILVWGYTIYFAASDMESKLLKKNYQEGVYEQEMQVEVTDEKTGETEKRNITVPVPEREYTQKEIDRYMMQALDRLPEEILGKNTGFGKIEHAMNLITELPDNPLQIEWISSDNQMLDWTGKIGSEVPADGVEVSLKAQIIWKNQIQEYAQKVRVYPQVLEDMDLQSIILQAVERENEGQEAEKYYNLPEVVNQKQLHWYQEKSKTGFIIIGLSWVLGMGFIMAYQQDQQKKTEQKKQQMMLDYPELISKLVLLLGAGMSIRKAIGKMAFDYENHRKFHNKEIRYAYEELCVVCQEIESGVGELEAYRHLGQRNDLIKFKTLSTLLTQNLKKGSAGMMEMLERESVEAFEDRKRQARVMGEEAGTKLLLPMILMMMVVFAILIVPAVLSF